MGAPAFYRAEVAINWQNLRENDGKAPSENVSLAVIPPNSNLHVPHYKRDINPTSFKTTLSIFVMFLVFSPYSCGTRGL